MRGRIAVGVPLACMLLCGPAAYAQEVTYSGGVFYAGGSYIFDQRTDAVYFSNGLRLEIGSWEIGGSLPIVAQNGGVVTAVAGGVPLPTGGAENGVVSRRRGGGTVGTRRHGGGGQLSADSVTFDDSFATHIGDPSLSSSVELYSGFGVVRSLRVNGSAKVPLNDEDSGVGSGAWDVGAGSSVALSVGSALLFLDASYWWLGDMSELQLNDILSYGVGASFSLPAGTSLLVTASGMSAAIDGFDPPVSLGASISRGIGDRGFLSGGLGVGLTESAPSIFAQLGWSIRLSGT